MSSHTHSRRAPLGLLLAIAALALLVLPASASATTPTTLCSEALAKCDALKRYPSGTTIEASLKSGTEFTFKANMTMKCTGSTLSGKTTSAWGTPLPLEVTSISISGCTGCSSSEFQNLPYGGSAEQSTGNDANVTLKSSGKGEPRLKLNGCLGANCAYGVSELGLTLQGGNPGTLVAKEATLSRKEGNEVLCGNTGKLNATYTINAPKPVYASQPAETVLCKENADPCPAANTYGEGTSLEATLSSPKLKFSFGGIGSVECTGSTLAGTINGKPAVQLPGELTTWSMSGCSVCESVKWLLPATTSLEATGNGNGDLTVKDAMIAFKGCFEIFDCKFEGNLHLEVHGGNPASIEVKNAKLGFIQGSPSKMICGETLTIKEGGWEVNTPKPLWIAALKS